VRRANNAPLLKPNTLRKVTGRNKEECGRRGILHIWVRGEEYTEFWWEILRKTENFEDQGVCRRIILKLIFKN